MNHNKTIWGTTVILAVIAIAGIVMVDAGAVADGASPSTDSNMTYVEDRGYVKFSGEWEAGSYDVSIYDHNGNQMTSGGVPVLVSVNQSSDPFAVFVKDLDTGVYRGVMAGTHTYMYTMVVGEITMVVDSPSVSVNPDVTAAVTVSFTPADTGMDAVATGQISLSYDNSKILVTQDAGTLRYNVESRNTVTSVTTVPVTFSYSVDGKVYTASVDVTVSPRYVSSITVSGGVTEIGLGRTADTAFTAAVSPADATTIAIEWRSTDESILTIDSDGFVKGIKLGQCRIYAVAKDGSDVRSNEMTVDVVPVELEKIEIIGESVLTVGTKTQFTLRFTPADATYKDVAWSSSDESKITVSNGYVKVLAFSASPVTITATSTKANVSGSIDVTTEIQPLTSVSIDGPNKIIAGESVTLILNADAPYSSVVWSSSNSQIADVDNNGRVSTTLMSMGAVTISVKVTDFDNNVKESSIKLQVVSIIDDEDDEPTTPSTPITPGTPATDDSDDGDNVTTIAIAAAVVVAVVAALALVALRKD